MAVVVLRTAVALVVLAAVTWSAVTADPFIAVNFFGYFTIQSNLAAAVVALAGAARVRRRVAPTLRWSVLRWASTTYLVIVGIVYWTLLAPLETAADLASWTNLVLHALGPAAALVDWLVVRDRTPVPASRLPLVLVYPLVWLVVVLVRGATDGWVPYPFLDPQQGYGVVAGWIALVTGTFALVAALLRLAPVPRPRARGSSTARRLSAS